MNSVDAVSIGTLDLDWLPLVQQFSELGKIDQRKHQSSASLAFVRGIHREPVNSPHTWSVTRKRFPFDDVIMNRD